MTAFLIGRPGWGVRGPGRPHRRPSQRSARR
jgi:hypothetical protein